MVGMQAAGNPEQSSSGGPKDQTQRKRADRVSLADSQRRRLWEGGTTCLLLVPVVMTVINVTLVTPMTADPTSRPKTKQATLLQICISE